MYVDHSIYKLTIELKYESIYDRIKLKIIKNIKKYSITPLILISGFADCVLLDNNKIVWPWFKYPSNKMSKKLKVNWDVGTIRTDRKLTCIFKEEYSKFHFFIQNLHTLGYKNEFDYKAIPYDFRIVGEPEYMSNLLDYFKKYVIILFQNSSKKVIIISYDFGCILTQIFLNNINIEFKEQFIDKSIMINPTLGGNIYTIRHCPSNMFYCFSGIQMQLPYYSFYGDINQEFFNSVNLKIKYFYNKVIIKFQEKSFNDPDVNVIVIRNLLSPDIRNSILEKIITRFKYYKIINLKIKNDNNILINKQLINNLINYIMK